MAKFLLTVVIGEEQAASILSEKDWQKALSAHVDQVLEPHRSLDDCPPYQRTCHCVAARHSDREEELDARFGSWKSIVEKFEKTAGPPPAFAGLKADAAEAERQWNAYLTWLEKWEAAAAQRLAQIRTPMSIASKPNPNCNRCQGSGLEEMTYRTGRFDYLAGLFDRDPTWHELNEVTGVIHELFMLAPLYGTPSYQAWSGTLTRERALRYAIRRAPYLMGSAIVQSNGEWLEDEPGGWGIAHLPSDMSRLSFYAADEFWPRTLDRKLAPHLRDNDLCYLMRAHC